MLITEIIINMIYLNTNSKIKIFSNNNLTPKIIFQAMLLTLKTSSKVIIVEA